jgi:hypothetical protein
LAEANQVGLFHEFLAVIAACMQQGQEILRLPHPLVKDPFGCRGHQKLYLGALGKLPLIDITLAKSIVT